MANHQCVLQMAKGFRAWTWTRCLHCDTRTKKERDEKEMKRLPLPAGVTLRQIEQKALEQANLPFTTEMSALAVTLKHWRSPHGN
ncbi:hypothetical protein ACLKA6_002739 [Drosophila palustris]